MIINMVGGGGSNPLPTDAVLRVTAPSGSTVTITKSGVTRTPNFYLDGTDKDEYFFYIKVADFGTYTVTATRGEQMASESVAVSAPQEYEIALYFIVPFAYQAVEYLESTGTQFITTNITACQDGFRLVTDFLYTSPVNYGMMFGRQGAYGNPAQSIMFRGAESSLSAKAGTGTMQSLPLTTIANQWYSVDFSCVSTDAYIVINNNRASLTGGNTSLGQSIKIFCGNDESGANTAKYFVNAKFKRLSLFDSGQNLIGDFCPCYRKSDNVAGMWDRVTETFFTNAGTGTFIVGAPI